jgi:TPR repeat protein
MRFVGLTPDLGRQLLTIFAVALALLGQALLSPAHAFVHFEWTCPKDKPRQLCLEDGELSYIYIYETISQNTADEVARLDGNAPPHLHFSKVYVNSLGGDVNAARQIARILRRREATVETRDAFFPSKRAECFSACVTIAAGGVVRRLTHIGIHQTAIYAPLPNRQKKREIIQEIDRRLSAAFWVEMGIPQEINEIKDATPHEDIAEFNLDPSLPLDDQMIVRLGFWMGPIDPSDETRIANKSNDLDVFVAAWKRGNAYAALEIGSRFSSGRDGFPFDIGKAKVWFERAGAAGIPSAWHNLAVLIDSKRNRGSPDLVDAIKYFRRAAEAGFAGAQNNLGWAYYKGDGVKQNFAEAIYWLTRAVEQGEPFAYGSLGDMRFHQSGFHRDDIETYKWLKLAVDNLPLGKARDRDRKLFEAVKARMSPDQIARAEARASAWKPLRQSEQLIGNKAD